MYKKQVSLQKILCFLAIGVSTIVFIYSLGIITDLYDALYSTMQNPNNLLRTTVPGSIVFYEMQGYDVATEAFTGANFSQNFLVYGVVMLLLALLLFITNTHIRRRYYIGNYVASALWAAAGIGGAIWAHGQIEFYKAKFLQIDFEALKAHSEIFKTLYTESTFWFDVHYFVFALVILVAVLLIANVCWKISLMKQEAALLAGEGQKSAV